MGLFFFEKNILYLHPYTINHLYMITCTKLRVGNILDDLTGQYIVVNSFEFDTNEFNHYIICSQGNYYAQDELNPVQLKYFNNEMFEKSLNDLYYIPMPKIKAELHYENNLMVMWLPYNLVLEVSYLMT